MSPSDLKRIEVAVGARKVRSFALSTPELARAVLELDADPSQWRLSCRREARASRRRHLARRFGP